jgi:lipid-A-disaccharide synthase
VSLIYLVAGEASGDILGARLIAALRQARPDLTFAGVGGPRMADQGVASLFDHRELALMGLLEVLPKLRLVKRRLTETVADIAARRPAVVVTIDSPGFGLRVLKRVAPLGIRRIQYVAPQVWAWRQGRVRKYPGLWDRLLCLLPFEPEFFARHGLEGRFVGHPVLESGADRGDAGRFRAQHGLAGDARVVIVMPGSRPGEVRRLLAPFADAIARVPGIVPVVPVAPAVAGTVRSFAWTTPPILVEGEQAKHDAFAAASVALAKSGISSLELAVADVPHLIAYRANPVTAALVRRVVMVKYASLVNLLSDGEVVPELIQQDCVPEQLAATLRSLLERDGITQRAAFAKVRDALRAPSGLPSEAAAAEVLALLDQS